MTYEEAVKKFGLLEDFQKNSRKSRVFWTGPIDPERVGPSLFSFDKKHVYCLFSFPDELTDEEVRIFCEDEPYWADFFRPRIEITF